MFDVKQELPKAPLYREEFEHDNCGIGACVNIHGEKSRATVENALKIVENLEHRAGKDAEGKTGDGVGILPPGRAAPQPGEEDVRDHCGKRRNGIPRLA